MRTKMLVVFMAGCAVGTLFSTWVWWAGPVQTAIFGEQGSSGPLRSDRIDAMQVIRYVATGAPGESPLPRLRMPIAGVAVASLHDSFHDARNGHEHEALDISAPRRTPVHAVAEGTVVKLFTSKAGGLTVYQFDNAQAYCFYYAHLDGYAPGIREGVHLRPGDVLGYVGTTGDAPPNAPHLHLAVFRLGPEKHWWQGTAIDPLPLLSDTL